MFSKNFRTKASATKYMKSILKKGQPLDTFDKLLVVEVFKHHYKYEEEAEVGTLVEQPFLLSLRGHWTFAFPRYDGRSPWNPSYKTAIRGPKGPRPADQARDAMWRDIRSQMVNFKEKRLASQIVQDPYTGEILTKDNCEADHDSAVCSFAGLINAWLESEGLTLSDLEVIDAPHTGYHTMKDSILRESWQQFHREKARLRFLSKRSHEEITRRQRD